MMTDRDPNRPLSFARDCFIQDGTRTEYVVLRSAIHSGPLVTSNEAEAREYARRTGRTVAQREVPVMRRIKWHDD